MTTPWSMQHAGASDARTAPDASRSYTMGKSITQYRSHDDTDGDMSARSHQTTLTTGKNHVAQP
jgi:hypothetical protein